MKASAPTLAVDATLDDVRALLRRGLTLQAWRAALPLGPPETWPTLQARLLGASLLDHAGADRRGRLLILRCWRAARRHPQAALAYALATLDQRGPIVCWELTTRIGTPDSMAPEQEAKWWLVRAAALSMLRDFASADELIARARAANPGEPWIDVVEAGVLAQQDRHEQALEVALKRLWLGPGQSYRAGVQQAGRLLAELGREEEAIDLLAEHDARLESAEVALQLAHLQLELGRLEAARASCLRAVALSPATDGDGFRAHSMRLADIAYRMGDWAEAVRLTRGAGAGASSAEALERIEKARRCGRVCLPVRFVRQHHMTCAPATLAALSAFWDKPAEHLEIAEAICYDGTPAHSERRWAERSGYVARQFTVDWEVARALVDRGLPFTMAIVSPGSAHLVAVVGYDDVRRSLLVRDPTFHWIREAEIEHLLAGQASTGPRGMTLVPVAQAERLAGLRLPDAELYDRVHAIEIALDENDRAAAVAELEALRALAPDHRLTLQAERAVAAYDDDPHAIAPLHARELARWPDDVNVQLRALQSLSRLERRQEERARLQELARAADAEPIILTALASVLADDARQADEVEWLVWRAHRAGAMTGEGLALIAHVLARRGRRAEALERLRLAACLEDKHEGRAFAYWEQLAAAQGTEPALAWLRDRARHLGRTSSAPALTLAQALLRLDRRAEAFQALDEAIAARPADAELRLQAATLAARVGQSERAAEHLAAAEGRSPPLSWLRAAAEVAQLRGDREQALARWRQLLEREPLALDAHLAVCAHLAAQDGPMAPIEHLRAAVARFPHHRGLATHLAIALRDVDPAEASERLRGLLAVHPGDAWALRELALRASQLGDHDEARRLARTAREVNPAGTVGWMVLGSVEARAGAREAAADAYRQAIADDPRDPQPLVQLLHLCASSEERWGAMELARRSTAPVPTPEQAEGLARSLLSDWFPAQVLELLRGTQQSFPGDLSAWLALITHLRSTGQCAEALELAGKATEQFPMRPEAYLELGYTAAQLGDETRERHAFTRALEVDAGATDAARALATVHARGKRFAEARAVLDAAALRAPDDAQLQVLLARVRSSAGETAEAAAGLVAWLRHHPRAAIAWRWLLADGMPAETRAQALALARELAERPHAPPEVLLALADPGAGAPAEELAQALAACDRAIAAAPLEIEGHDAKAQLLSRAGRVEEALAACRPSVWGAHPPSPLAGRAAWVMAQHGRRTEAIAEMARLLGDDPSYGWGVVRLLEWCRAEGDHATVLRLAPQLERGLPADADLRVSLAHACIAAGRGEEAQAWMEKALALEPRNPEAAQLLFDAHLAAGRLEEARRALSRCDEADPFAAARAVQLAARERDELAALTAFARVCDHDADEGWPMAAASEALARIGLDRDAQQLMERRVQTGAAAWPLVRAWVEGLTRRLWAPLVWWRLARLRKRAPEAGLQATALYLEMDLLEPQALQIFSWLWGRGLARFDRTWSALGNALLNRGFHRKAWRWFRGWRNRAELRPYMLVNAALAMRAGGDAGEAAAAHAHALSLPADHARDEHLLWSALDAAAEGDGARARKLLQQRTGPEEQDKRSFAARMERLTQALTEWAEGGGDRRAAEQRVRAALGDLPPLGPLTRAIRRQVTRALER